MEKLKTAKEFVARNSTKILLGTTVASAATVLVMRYGLKQHDDFLKEKGLFDEFYHMEDI